MKKLFLSLLSLVISITMFAQSNVRKMNLIYDGQVVYSRAVSLIDSIKFVWSDGSGSDDDITGGEVDPTKQLYVGVVAFNRDVRQMAITSDMDAVKAFINEQTNDKDFTAFAYSVSQGNKQFDAAGLPEFDNIFMLNFSDGTDNYSNMKWGEEGRNVPPSFVYDTARYDLLQRTGLNSYAIGFGNDVGFGEKMKKVVTGSGGYYNAKSSNDLQSTFNEIAKSMLASAKNVLLKTNPGYYSGYYKYFRFKFTAEGGYTDVIYAQMDGTPTTGYTLAISKIENGYAYFDAPAKGVVDDETGKVHIPLNNLKFVKDGKELQYKYTIEVSFDGELYYEDVEEASTADEISKRIAVVLVLDCSTSMGDAFAPMKAAAIKFIETIELLRNAKPDVSTPSGTNNGHDYVDLGLSVKWATCNVGASKPEYFGYYLRWGEIYQSGLYTCPQLGGESDFTYKWGDWYYNLYKYNTDSDYGYVDNKVTLDSEDDAATVYWGNTWRMPTEYEIVELIDKCVWVWTTLNGTAGFRVIGNNGNSIFLPAAGDMVHVFNGEFGYGEGISGLGSYGRYWSRSLNKGDSWDAEILDFNSNGRINKSSRNRYVGLSVRPVCP